MTDTFNLSSPNRIIFLKHCFHPYLPFQECMRPTVNLKLPYNPVHWFLLSSPYTTSVSLVSSLPPEFPFLNHIFVSIITTLGFLTHLQLFKSFYVKSHILHFLIIWTHGDHCHQLYDYTYSSYQTFENLITIWCIIL